MDTPQPKKLPDGDIEPMKKADFAKVPQYLQTVKQKIAHEKAIVEEFNMRMTQVCTCSEVGLLNHVRGWVWVTPGIAHGARLPRLSRECEAYASLQQGATSCSRHKPLEPHVSVCRSACF